MQEELLRHINDPMYFIFAATAACLQLLALIPKTDYQFWNIVIWFGLIPATWIYLISLKTTKWLNTLSVLLLSYIFWQGQYHAWFDMAVEF